MKRLTREDKTSCDICAVADDNGRCILNDFPCPKYIQNERLKAYENTGLEPEEISRLKVDVEEIKKSVDSLWEKQEFIKFLEAKGIDVSAGVNWMCNIFDLLHDEKNEEIISIDRLRELVGADREGRLEIFSSEGPPTVFYIPDYEDGLCLKDVSGLISKEEFEKVHKRVKEEFERDHKEE